MSDATAASEARAMADFLGDRMFVKLIYFDSGEETFVSWACGAFTTETLAEIEAEARENMDEIFTKGEGGYTFEMSHISSYGQHDDEWEFELLFFVPPPRGQDNG